jgi:CRP-like cAMP-binding protein
MASTDKLRKYLEQFNELSQQDWDLFQSKLHLEAFERKQLILKAGEVENYVSYIERGIIRYFVAEEEKEITFEIAFENSFATAYDSFLTRTPVSYHAEALADTELWRISYADLQVIYTKTRAGDKIGRLAAEQLYIRKNERQLSFLKDSAEHRYLALLRDHAHFIQLVPLKYLASYIGITPQALSRIRRRIAGAGLLTQVH